MLWLNSFSIVIKINLHNFLKLASVEKYMQIYLDIIADTDIISVQPLGVDLPAKYNIWGDGDLPLPVADAGERRPCGSQ